MSVMSRLVAEPKILNELPISFDVGTPEVGQEPAPLSNHFQQSTAAMVVLGVRAEVIGQVIDPLGEQRNLHARRTGVGVALSVLGDRRCFFKSHVVYSPRRPAPCEPIG